VINAPDKQFTDSLVLRHTGAERGHQKAPEEDVVRGHDVSDDADGSVPTWRRSSRSYGSGNCLEVAAHGARVDVRDSKDPYGAGLRLTPAEWRAFVANVRGGQPGR
jgi:Domain of unknown function (DUF397)